MAPVLLFITGVLAGLVAGSILSRLFQRASAGERQQALQAREALAISRTELEAVLRERDALQRHHDSSQALLEQIRAEREDFRTRLAETSEQLRSQQSQVLENACADLLTQFRLLSGQMLDGCREALLQSTRETVSDPITREVQQLRQQVEALQKDTGAMLTRLLETSRDLRQGEQLQELSTRLRALVAREASVRAEAYAMLEIVTHVVGHLEDSGNQLSHAFDAYQQGRRAYNGGGGIALLTPALIDFLNRWTQVKQRFAELSARQQALRGALETQPEQPGGQANGRSAQPSRLPGDGRRR